MAVTITQPGNQWADTQVGLLSVFLWRHNQLGQFDCHYTGVTAMAGGVYYGEIAASYGTLLEPHLQAIMDTDTFITGFKFSAVGVAPFPLPGVAVSDAMGSSAPPGLPGQVSGIFTKTTLYSGKAYRGRCYIPFPASVYQDTDDTPTNAYKSGLLNIATDLISTNTVVGASMGQVTLTPVIYNRTSKETTVITGANIRKYWATQKRRGNLGRTNPNIVP